MEKYSDYRVTAETASYLDALKELYALNGKVQNAFAEQWSDAVADATDEEGNPKDEDLKAFYAACSKVEEAIYKLLARAIDDNITSKPDVKEI